MNPTDKQQLLSIGEASEYLGVSIDTLRRWGRKGKIETHRSPGGHRYFSKNDLDELFGTRYERGETKREDKVQQPGTIQQVAAEEQVQETPKETIADQEVKKETNGHSAQQEEILNKFDRPTRKFEIPTSEPVKIKTHQKPAPQQPTTQANYHPSFSHLPHAFPIPSTVPIAQPNQTDDDNTLLPKISFGEKPLTSTPSPTAPAPTKSDPGKKNQHRQKSQDIKQYNHCPRSYFYNYICSFCSLLIHDQTKNGLPSPLVNSRTK